MKIVVLGEIRFIGPSLCGHLFVQDARWRCITVAERHVAFPAARMYPR